MNNIIDEIKKTLELKTDRVINKKLYSEGYKYGYFRCSENVFEILDKYQDQEDVYKKCWEELTNYINANHYGIVSRKMNDIKQKHNIKESD